MNAPDTTPTPATTLNSHEMCVRRVAALAAAVDLALAPDNDSPELGGRVRPHVPFLVELMNEYAQQALRTLEAS